MRLRGRLRHVPPCVRGSHRGGDDLWHADVMAGTGRVRRKARRSRGAAWCWPCRPACRRRRCPGYAPPTQAAPVDASSAAALPALIRFLAGRLAV